nr:dol-p-glc:glc(2)man(9)glcnac(2)-pp-dol alpha-1,2-glucosyltransferase [Quercus suber]
MNIATHSRPLALGTSAAKTFTMAAAVASLLIPLSSWFYSVQNTVFDPYLDEFFHVRQAQHYCAGRFQIWDPKITTPPGLYLLSSLAAPFAGSAIPMLRALSALCLCLLVFAVAKIYSLRSSGNARAQHSALNVALFPPLFFFTALYYTDVASTLSVLLFYLVFLRSYQKGRPSLAQNVLLVLLGSISLLFRQTNIFWVAVFPAGVVLIHELDQGHDAIRDSMHRGSQGFGDNIYSVIKTSWKMRVIYSPAVGGAWFEGIALRYSIYHFMKLTSPTTDYVRTVLSISVCACRVAIQPAMVFQLISALAPYLTLIISFAGFILVNGSVVLGDKTNHVATLHGPQMLYLWPYLVFFSWPLILPKLLLVPLTAYAKMSKTLVPETILPLRRQNLLPRVSTVALCTCAAIAMVRFNTIVHPFTLADNRHYTFYVFRLLLRPWYIRYTVTPIYILCGWASIERSGDGSAKRLFLPAVSEPSRPVAASSNNSKTQAAMPKPLAIPDGVHPASISFVLLWLATTALQLITAPLVEPRYFILPWLFWRIHLPLATPSPSPRRSALDPRLCVETVWLLLINALTGYIFLQWGFTWPQEPGAVQRFMW